MTWVKIVYLYCDGGDCPRGGEPYLISPLAGGSRITGEIVKGQTISEQRKAASREGWRHRGNHDYCSECAK